MKAKALENKKYAKPYSKARSPKLTLEDIRKKDYERKLWQL